MGGRVGIYSENRLRLFQDFTGTWKFKVGDDMDWKNKDFDDSDWKKVNVPATWSEYGYGDYDGYGWYRKTFTPNRNLEDQTLIFTPHHPLPHLLVVHYHSETVPGLEAPGR